MAVIECVDVRLSPLVTLSGEVDERGSRTIEDVLKSLFNYGCASPRLNLAGVRSMSSDGLTALTKWRRHFRDNEGDFEVVSINPQVRSLFETSGFADVVGQSEDHDLPLLDDRTPITDCLAVVGDWEMCSFSVAPRLESCKIIRDRACRMMSNLPFTEQEQGDIRLAVGEAASNAVRHGCRGFENETITVRCFATSRRLVVEISDPGPGFDPDTVRPPLADGDLPEGGMGILCMRRSVDEVSFDFSAGTTVRLVKYAESEFTPPVEDPL